MDLAPFDPILIDRLSLYHVTTGNEFLRISTNHVADGLPALVLETRVPADRA